MKSTSFKLTRYDSDKGYVFDWKEPRFIEIKNEAGEVEQVQDHLNVVTLFIGASDSIDNYIEVPIEDGDN